MITRADLLGRGRIRIQSVYITEPDCYRCIVFKFSVAV